MRADRLVAIVLLLQAHGQRTAGQLAEALEASERTIRRDLDALSAAGVPVYAQRGRGGGWALLGGHRIDLTGLTAAEARALVLAAAGAPDQAGVEAALRKVVAALPAPLQAQVEAARASTHVDPSAWGRGRSPGEGEGPVLEVLRDAVAAGVQVDLRYARPGAEEGERRVHPHGLVAKRGVWYLMATGPSGLRTYRVSRIRAASATAEAAVRPEGFDLRAAWEGMQRTMSERLAASTLTVEVLVDADAWERFHAVVGAWWDVSDRGVDGGRRRAVVQTGGVAHATRELLAFGDAVEVVGPPEVRAELAAAGARLVRRYG